MIDYSLFWEILKDSTLINKHHISSSTVNKLRKNKPLNTTTLNDLCCILKYQIQDVSQYVTSKKTKYYNRQNRGQGGGMFPSKIFKHLLYIGIPSENRKK